MSSQNSKPIYDYLPFTHLDYPGKLASIAWFVGCNMRCRYCYNSAIVHAKTGRYAVQEWIDFLKKRIGLLDGVVLCGGEPTLHDLLPICRSIKEMGFSIKLDTNGSDPYQLQRLLEENLLDSVALDFKAPRSLFTMITRASEKLYDTFERSLDLLLCSGIDLELRTTVHPKLLGAETLDEMHHFLREKGYKSVYYLQPCLADTPTLDPLEHTRIPQEMFSRLNDKKGVIWRSG